MKGPGIVRISGGQWRGRRLTVPRNARPTEGRVREALVSIWQDRLPDSRFLDLFAGSGAVGVEALSRGALEATLVDSEAGTLRALAAARKDLGGGGLRLMRLRLPAGMESLQEGGPYDLVFADPPYRFDSHAQLLEGLAPLLADDGEVAIEHGPDLEPPEEAGGLVRTDRRRYGGCRLSFYRPEAINP